jgi:hypothetical protein
MAAPHANQLTELPDQFSLFAVIEAGSVRLEGRQLAVCAKR